MKTKTFATILLLFACLLTLPAQETAPDVDAILSQIDNEAMRFAASNGPVGTPAGAFSVSPTGGAAYAVTIDTPPCTTSLSPTVTIAYNSQGGNGIAGYGCQVGGFSVITRVPKDLHHDGISAGVSYGTSDALALDGKRLVLETGQSLTNGAVYSLYGDPFTKVTVHEDSGVTWFEVLTREGLKYHYGHDATARQTFFSGGSSHTSAWYVDEVTNAIGETITVRYTVDNLFVYPQNIWWGGPNIRKITFSYEDRPDTETFRLGGLEGKMRLRLSTVNSYAGENIYRSYELTYDEQADQTERPYSRLASVTEKNGSGEQLPPLQLEWQGLPQPALEVDSADINLPISEETEVNIEFNERYFSVGDINNDGITDVVQISPVKEHAPSHYNVTANHTYAYLNLSQTDEEGTHSYRPLSEVVDFPGNISYDDLVDQNNGMSIIDIDGDHYQDLVMPKTLLVEDNGLSQLQVFYFRGRNFLHLSNYTILHHQSQFIAVPIQNNSDIPLYTLADFDNDGKAEMFHIEKGLSNNKYHSSLTGLVENDTFHSIPLEISLPTSPQSIFTGDYNNDGLLDIIILFDGGYRIFYNQGGKDDQNPFTDAENCSQVGYDMTYTRHMSQGDFNGDGLVDFVYNIPGESQFRFALNKGDGSFETVVACTIEGVFDKPGTVKDDDRFTLLPCDIDHDGRTDLIVAKAHYEYHGMPAFRYDFDYNDICWLRSTGSSLAIERRTRTYEEDDAKAYNLMLGDFTGNGEVQLMNYGSDLHSTILATTATAPNMELADGEQVVIQDVSPTEGDEPQFPIDEDEGDQTTNVRHTLAASTSAPQPLWIYRNTSFLPTSGKLTAVTDGFGNRTDISYASLADGGVYTPETSAAYPLADITLPLHVVSGTTATNGAAGAVNMSYAYGGMKAHMRGLGLLGFATTTATNETTGQTVTTQLSNWNMQRFVPQTALTTTEQGGCTATSETTQAVSERQYGNCWLHPVSKTDTDIYGNETTTTYTFDPYYGDPLTERTEYGSADMYRETQWSGYTGNGWRRQPTLVTVTRQHSDDSQPFTDATHYTYNYYGLPLEVTEHHGSSLALTHHYSYDSHGRIIDESTTGSGIEELSKHYLRDVWGRITGTYTTPASTWMAYTYGDYDQMLTETDRTDNSNPLTTTYTYDGWGNLACTTRPDGTQTQTTRSWGTSSVRRYAIEQTATGQPWQRTWYDGQGRETCTETVGPGGVNLTDITTYNSKGLPASKVSITGQLSIMQTMGYDALGRLTSTNSTSGQSSTVSYGDREETTTTGDGRTFTKNFDAWGNVTCSSDPVSQVSYTYASCGKPATATVEGSTVSMEYDECGNQTLLCDPDAGTTTYDYDAMGRVVAQTDARGITSTTTYDAYGRIVEKTAGDDTTTYTYGTSGTENMLLTAMQNATGTVSYTHDQYGRLLTETRTMGSDSPLVFSYAYNSLGQLASKTYPGNVTATYHYDANGYEDQMAVNDTVVWQLTANNGRVTTETLGGGALTRTLTRNAQGFLTNMQTLHGANAVSSMTFGYNAQTGNLTSRTGMRNQAETFAYDSLDRLTSVCIGNTQSVSMSYDDNGNILGKTGLGSYNYDALLPHAVTETGMPIANDTTSIEYNYNALGKICEIYKGKYSHGPSATFMYGPDGERWKSTVTTWVGNHPFFNTIYLPTTKTYIYAGDYQQINTNALFGTKKYIDLGHGICYYKYSYFSLSIRPRERKLVTGSRLLYACTDNLGSITRLVDGQGSVVFSASYDAWGNQTVLTDSIGFRRGFTGHEHIPEFGLINMNGRLYDPATGTFLSPDNYVQAPYSSQSFNRYSYCLNNPLKYTDPSGELFGIDDAFFAFTVFNVASSMMQAAYSGKNVWKAGAISLLSSFGSYGIGELFGHSTSSFGSELLRAGAHGINNGLIGALDGNGFGTGFYTGFFASLASSGAQAIGINTYIAGASAGAIASLISGGDVINGALRGFDIGAYNHGWTTLNGESVYELDEVVVVGHRRDALFAVHSLLDVAGMFLDVADVANGVLYTFQGDYMNAGLSMASMVPILGSFATSGKYARSASEIINVLGSNFTKSSLKHGQEVHKLYKINKVVIKEYNGIKGIRPDFVDFQNHKIYELKPYNPWSVRRGIRQLDKYKTVFDSKYSVENGWESIIVFY